MYTKESLKNFFISHVMIAGITDSIKDLKDYYDPSILETLFTWKLPVMICDRDTFTNIVNDIVNGTFNQQFYMTQLKMKYDSFIDSL